MTTIALFAMESNYKSQYRNNLDEIHNNFPYVENQFLGSSRFTQKSEVSPEKLTEYNENYKISYTLEELDFLGYEKMLENNSYELYFENNSYSIVLIDKETGFMWSSRAEFQDDLERNDIIRNQMNSGIWIDYVNTNNVQYQPTRMSVYRAADVWYYLDSEEEGLA